MSVLPDDPPVIDRSRASAAQVWEWLRGGILAGRLPPGQELSENDIAQRLGVSRTPVREAFVRLAGEGLLAVRPQVGTSVAPIDVDAVADSQFLRETIECRTVGLAAARVTEDDARELRRQLREQERVAARGEHTGFVELDDVLHQRLLAIAGRPRVWNAVEAAKAQLDRVRHLSLEDPRWLATIVAQHEEIVRHVIAHDAPRATRAMARHLRTVFASIERLAAKRPEFFRHPPAQPDRAVADIRATR